MSGGNIVEMSRTVEVQGSWPVAELESLGEDAKYVHIERIVVQVEG